MEKEILLEQAARARCQGNTARAKKLYQKVYKDDKIEALSGIGLCYKMEYKTKQALKYFLKAVKVAEKGKKFRRTGGIFRDIGITYEYIKNYSKAEEFVKKSIEILKKYGPNLDKNPQLGISIGKLGLFQLRQEKLKEAERNLKKGVEIVQKAKHDFYSLTMRLHLAEFYLKTGKLKKAYELAKLVNFESLQKGWAHRFAQSLVMEGAILASLGKLEESTYKLCLGLLISKLFDSKEVKKEIERRVEEVIKDFPKIKKEVIGFKESESSDLKA